MSTTIEWTDETWNPVTGCDKISPGCTRCYAKALHDMRHKAWLNGKKMPAQYSVPFEQVQCWPDRLEIPLHWRAPRLCFINSMADLFHEDVPFSFIASVLYTVACTRSVTYQALTKRADRMLEFFSGDYWKLYNESLRWEIPQLLARSLGRKPALSLPSRSLARSAGGRPHGELRTAARGSGRSQFAGDWLGNCRRGKRPGRASHAPRLGAIAARSVCCCRRPLLFQTVGRVDALGTRLSRRQSYT